MAEMRHVERGFGFWHFHPFKGAHFCSRCRREPVFGRYIRVAMPGVKSLAFHGAGGEARNDVALGKHEHQDRWQYG